MPVVGLKNNNSGHKEGKRKLFDFKVTLNESGALTIFGRALRWNNVLGGARWVAGMEWGAILVPHPCSRASFPSIDGRSVALSVHRDLDHSVFVSLSENCCLF